MMKKKWYKSFLLEIEMIEKEVNCPICDGTIIMHINPMGYDFVCSFCSHTFEYEKGKHKDKFNQMLGLNKKQEE